MKYVIVVKEVKEIYHQIEFDTEDDKLINQVAAGIDMGDFDDIDRAKNAIGRNYPSIDHMIPVVRGGLHSWKNVKLAHVGCNASKGAKVI
jgi:hypothetical protein